MIHSISLSPSVNLRCFIFRYLFLKHFRCRVLQHIIPLTLHPCGTLLSLQSPLKPLIHVTNCINSNAISHEGGFLRKPRHSSAPYQFFIILLNKKNIVFGGKHGWMLVLFFVFIDQLFVVTCIILA